MNPVDDEAPTRVRKVIHERNATDVARTKVFRASTRASTPFARAAATDTDPTRTVPGASMASVASAPHAQTVVSPLRARVAEATPAPRSQRRELVVRCGLAVAVSMVALCVALASTNSLPTNEPAQPDDLALANTNIATSVTTAPAPSMSATDPNAPRPATSSTKALAPKAVASAGRDRATPVAPPAEAARLLATGAYAPALDAYRGLAQAQPDEPVYAVITRVLARNLGARCDRSQTPGDPTCSTHETTAAPSSPR